MKKRNPPKIRSQYNYDHELERMEETQGPSMTIESETMTIQEIVKRHAAGMVQFEKPAVFVDAELDQIDKFYGRSLDLTDLDELKALTETLSETIARGQEELKNTEEEAKIDESDAVEGAEGEEAEPEEKK